MKRQDLADILESKRRLAEGLVYRNRLRDSADDLLNDVAVSLLKNMPANGDLPIESASAYVHRALFNQAFLAQRRQSQKGLQSLDFDPEDNRPHEVPAECQELISAVNSASERGGVSIRFAAYVVLNGVSVAELGKHLGISSDTAKQRFTRGIKRLRKSMEKTR